MKKNDFVILIDDSDIDNFINYKIIELCSVTNILVFNKASEAIAFLKKNTIPPTIIFIDLHMPLINGDDFIKEYRKLEISKYSTNIFILSASINPDDKKLAEKRKIEFIEKPLTREKMEKLLEYTHNLISIKCHY